MNTYRAFFLVRNPANPEQPSTVVAYVQGEKYDDAWKGGRKAVKGEEYLGKKAQAFVASDAKVPYPFKDATNTTLVGVDDIKVKKVKLDQAQLKALIADPKTSAEDKVKAMAAMVG